MQKDEEQQWLEMCREEEEEENMSRGRAKRYREGDTGEEKSRAKIRKF